jgi:ferritin-like metal-binding protein YciE
MATAKNSPKKTSKSRTSATNSNTFEENQTMLLEYFVDELKDIYWAEKHLVKNLPKFQKAATSEELATAFEDHLAVTEEQVSRLEQVFELLGEKARGKKCEAMDGLVKEGAEIIENTDAGSATRDVALIIGAQKIEHYEIATYGGLATLAKTLGKQDIANILGEILEEEKEADDLLTQLAENNVNQSAAAEPESEGQEARSGR